jgi:hypothetical protein
MSSADIEQQFNLVESTCSGNPTCEIDLWATPLSSTYWTLLTSFLSD